MKYKKIIYIVLSILLFIVFSLLSKTKNTLKNFDIQTKIETAIKENDINTINKLIKRIKDINIKDKSGFSLLHYAVKYENEDAIKLLIENRADINIKGPGEQTPLSYAITQNKRISIIKLLISLNADVNTIIHKYDKKTLLIYAVLDDNTMLFNALVESKNIDLNKTGYEHWCYTPLVYATRNNRIEMVKKLIEKGADINLIKGGQNKHYLSPISWAVREKNYEITKFLLDAGADINKIDKSGYGNLLHTVSSKKNIDFIKLLIEKGTDIDSRNYYGETPLMIASKSGNIEAVKLFIKHKAKLNLSNYWDGRTALAMAKENVKSILIKAGAREKYKDPNIDKLNQAIKNNNINEIKKYIDIVYDINERDKNGMTPLMMAAKNCNYPDIIKLILSKNASMQINIDWDNNYSEYLGKTHGDSLMMPLLLAIKYNKNIEVVEALINACNNLSLGNAFGKPLGYAITRENNYNPGLIKLLIKKGADIHEQTYIFDKRIVGSSIILATKMGKLDAVKILLNSGANIEDKNKYGATPLLVAVGANYKGIVDLLLNKQANVNIKNKEGETPLMIALKNGHPSSLILSLLNNGAEVNIKDNNNNSPLVYFFVSIIQWEKEDEKIYNLLLKNSADLKSVVNNNWLLIKSIKSKFPIKVIKDLIRAGIYVNAVDTAGRNALYYFLNINSSYDKWTNYENEVFDLLIKSGSKLLAEKGRPYELNETFDNIIKGKYPFETIRKLINITDNFNEDDLFYQASLNNNIDIVTNLIKSEMKIKKETLNASLIMTEKKEIIKILLKGGADVNARDTEGMTPLIKKIINCSDKEIINILIKNGADINVEDTSGFTPLELSYFYNCRELEEVLLENGAKKNSFSENKNFNNFINAFKKRDINKLESFIADTVEYSERVGINKYIDKKIKLIDIINKLVKLSYKNINIIDHKTIEIDINHYLKIYLKFYWDKSSPKVIKYIHERGF